MVVGIPGLKFLYLDLPSVVQCLFFFFFGGGGGAVFVFFCASFSHLEDPGISRLFTFLQ